MAEPPDSKSKRPVVDALRQELRRGTLVLAALAVLRSEGHGVAVREALRAGGVDIDDGALYPMLRRLEEQDLLTSEWRLDGARRKRFYVLTALGAATYDELAVAWRHQTDGLQTLMKRDHS
jgi:DNA-binding PadR family transcriptional regulator